MNTLDFFAPAAAGLWRAALNGWLLCLSLIVAIGAQNAFVLRQGLRREHVGLLVLACSLGDALLMSLGVAGLAGLMGQHPWLTQGLAAAGCVFLLVYGWRAWQRAWRPHSLSVAAAQPGLTRRAALLQLAGFSLLNPHVYLDTVLLVGAVGAQQAGPAARAAFVAGASAASLLWFTLLGYGARFLAPWFARPKAWQVLDGLIGLMMWGMVWALWPMVWGR
jgi:L-lysine exporter family protein LysE/ArgO